MKLKLEASATMVTVGPVPPDVFWPISLRPVQWHACFAKEQSEAIANVEAYDPAGAGNLERRIPMAVKTLVKPCAGEKSVSRRILLASWSRAWKSRWAAKSAFFLSSVVFLFFAIGMIAWPPTLARADMGGNDLPKNGEELNIGIVEIFRIYPGETAAFNGAINVEAPGELTFINEGTLVVEDAAIETLATRTDFESTGAVTGQSFEMNMYGTVDGDISLEGVVEVESIKFKKQADMVSGLPDMIVWLSPQRLEAGSLDFVANGSGGIIAAEIVAEAEDAIMIDSLNLDANYGGQISLHASGSGEIAMGLLCLDASGSSHGFVSFVELTISGRVVIGSVPEP